jgi:hypothetical protein
MSSTVKKCGFVLIAVFCLAAFSPTANADVILIDATWETVGSDVQFTLTFQNDDPLNTSPQGTGQLSSQEFGAFLDNFGLICNFVLPPLPPLTLFDVICTVPLSSLPPSATVLLPGGGGPSPPRASSQSGCPPNFFWAGNIDVIWTAGTSGGQVQVHMANLDVCPGGGPTYIHVIFDCPDPAGISWNFSGVCANWTATLNVSGATGLPGGPAPNPIPPGLFDGWICVSANASVPVGVTCHFDLNLTCGIQPATINLWARTCDWSSVPVEESTWGKVKALYKAE